MEVLAKFGRFQRQVGLGEEFGENSLGKGFQNPKNLLAGGFINLPEPTGNLVEGGIGGKN